MVTVQGQNEDFLMYVSLKSFHSLIWEETFCLLPVLPGSPSFLHIFLATVPGPTANLLLSYLVC